MLRYSDFITRICAVGYSLVLHFHLQMLHISIWLLDKDFIKKITPKQTVRITIPHKSPSPSKLQIA